MPAHNTLFCIDVDEKFRPFFNFPKYICYIFDYVHANLMSIQIIQNGARFASNTLHKASTAKIRIMVYANLLSFPNASTSVFLDAMVFKQKICEYLSNISEFIAWKRKTWRKNIISMHKMPRINVYLWYFSVLFL